MGDIRGRDLPLLRRQQLQEQEHGSTLVPSGWRVSLHCYVSGSYSREFHDSEFHRVAARAWSEVLGRQGRGDYWVAVHKTRDGNVGLYVKRNPYPRMVSQRLLKFRVIRERPNMNFDAEDVVVWGDEDGH